MEKVADAPEASVAIEQFTVPPAPTAGVVQVNTGPTVCEPATNVDPAGSGSLRATVCASLGPALATVIVYVRLLPALTVAAPDW